MSLRFPSILASAFLLTALTNTSMQGRELRVCADPDNLPFSNSSEQGFENKIARVVAQDLGANLQFVWQRMGRGFVREFIDNGRCDLLIGIPSDFRQLAVTRPYYRSTYVFLVRRDARVKPVSLDDPKLRNIKIGVQALDEQYSPPGQALAHRGLQAELVPFYGVGSNAATIVSAVSDGKVDAAVIWGPLAGYLARSSHPSLEMIPVKPESDPAGMPFTFAIAMGVRKGNQSLRNELDAIIQRRASEFRAILNSYAVPQLELAAATKEAD